MRIITSKYMITFTVRVLFDFGLVETNSQRFQSFNCRNCFIVRCLFSIYY